jgi:hypothetical protein
MKKTNREEPTYYGILPAEIRYAKNISPMEKIMYAEISALASKTGKCWGSNGYFAELYDVQPTTVSEWINNLERAGYVSITGAKSKNRVITLVNILRKKPKTPKELPEAQPSEKVEHNNTSVNNNINNHKQSQDKPVVDDSSLSKTIKEEPFSSELYMKGLMRSEDNAKAIIGYYGIRKRLYEKLTTKEAVDKLLFKRFIKVANDLRSVDRTLIRTAMDDLESEMINGQPKHWSLETVAKSFGK